MFVKNKCVYTNGDYTFDWCVPSHFGAFEKNVDEGKFAYDKASLRKRWAEEFGREAPITPRTLIISLSKLRTARIRPSDVNYEIFDLQCRIDEPMEFPYVLYRFNRWMMHKEIDRFLG